MKNVWTIASRELKSYFASPIAYVVSALFLVVSGFFFTLILISSQDASLRSSFSNMTFILILLAPALTMKLLAEEQRMGTIELLLTSPVNDWQVVLGKFLGGLILFAIMLVGPTLYYVLILKLLGSPDPGPIFTSYIGILLLGASFLSIGVFASSVTQNQVIAYFLGLTILILLWVIDFASSIAGTGPAGNIVTYLAITGHYTNFFQGVIDTQDVIYSLSVVVISLFLATQVVQTRRWR